MRFEPCVFIFFLWVPTVFAKSCCTGLTGIITFGLHGEFILILGIFLAPLVPLFIDTWIDSWVGLTGPAIAFL